MDSATLKQTLSTIHTFEDYEKLKQLIEKDLARAIIHKHQLSEAELTLFSDGTNIVFSYGEDKVIKIFPPFHQSQFESERLVLKHLDGHLSIKTPTLEHEGEIFGWPYIIISKLEGTNPGPNSPMLVPISASLISAAISQPDLRSQLISTPS